MNEYLIVKFNSEEDIVAVIKRSLWSDFFRIIFAFVWLLLPFFVFFPLLRLGLIGIVVLFLILSSAVWNIFSKYYSHKYTMFIVTDLRIIDVEQKGFFKRKISKVRFNDVRNAVFKYSGIMGKIFKIGKIRIKTKKQHEFDLEFRGIRYPQRVRDLILEVQCIQKESSK